MALGIDAGAAQKRVWRAVEKLRKHFFKRGVTLSAAALAGSLSAHSVNAAPAGMVPIVTASVTTKGTAAAATTTTLIKTALKIMALTKLQTTAVVGCAFLLVVAGTVPLVVNHKPAEKPEVLPPGVRRPVVSEDDQRAIDRWKQLRLTPLTDKAQLSAQVDKMPVDGQELTSPEAVTALRNYVRAFLTYASSNSFETYVYFRGITPDVKYQLSSNLNQQLRDGFHEPVGADGQIPLQRFYELASFGTDGRSANFWHFQAAGLDDARISIFETNQLAASYAQPLARAEFQSGGVLSTNTKFVWPHSKSDLLAKDGKLTVAVITVYLKTSGTPPDYPFPILLAFYWDAVGSRWVPDEMAQCREAHGHTLFF